MGKMILFVLVMIGLVGMALDSCSGGSESPSSPAGNSELDACYALAHQMADEGHSRDKQWLNDQLDYCDLNYG